MLAAALLIPLKFIQSFNCLFIQHNPLIVTGHESRYKFYTGGNVFFYTLARHTAVVIRHDFYLILVVLSYLQLLVGSKLLEMSVHT